MDDVWGRQGPYQTWFRNRIRGICVWAGHNNNSESDVIVSSYANLLLNSAWAYVTKPSCNGWPEYQNCHDFDVDTNNMWAEYNLARDTRTDGSPNAVDRYGFVLRSKEATTTFVNNLEADSSPASWAAAGFEESFWLSAAPDWWCSQTNWPAIGADVDDPSVYNQTSAHAYMLPAERRYRGHACTCAGIGCD
jgi:hypothetical protein